MSRIALVIAFALALIGTSLAQRAEIEAANAKWTEFYKQGDFAGIASLYTDDAIVLPNGSAMVQGRAAIEAMWKGILAEHVGDPKVTTLDVKPLGPSAAREIGTFSLKTKGPRPQEVSGKYVVVWEKVNLNLERALVLKFVQPLISLGAVVAREPNLTDPTALPARQIEAIVLPPLAATMDDCCRIGEMLPPPSGEAGLTIAILSIVSQLELSVSAVYTANPLTGDGISIDVEYIPSRRLVVGGQG